MNKEKFNKLEQGMKDFSSMVDSSSARKCYIYIQGSKSGIQSLGATPAE